jgi:hypothetical protein
MRVRSGYSFKTVYGHLKDVASRLSEVGWSHQPISDRASTFSFNRWSKTVKNPIYGVELAVVEDIEDKKASLDWWTFFAIKELQPLHALIGQATWYEVKEPSLTYQDMLAAKGVIKIAGEYAQLHNIKKPQKDMYVALSPATPIGLYKQARLQVHCQLRQLLPARNRQGDLSHRARSAVDHADLPDPYPQRSGMVGRNRVCFGEGSKGGDQEPQCRDEAVHGKDDQGDLGDTGEERDIARHV